MMQVEALLYASYIIMHYAINTTAKEIWSLEHFTVTKDNTCMICTPIILIFYCSLIYSATI